MGRTYLYGIVGSADGTGLGFAGLDGASPVYAVVRDGIGCVVSEYSGEDFGGLSKEKLVRCLLAHQQVVERVMRDHTVLPVRFGTVLSNAQEVLYLLSQGHSEFANALASIQDRVEIEVAATWDTGQVLGEISKEEEVVRAREAIARKGQPTAEERVRLGQIVKSSMDRRRDGYRERMLGVLEPLAADVAPNAMVSDQMVMNVAFLVDRPRRHEFDAAVEYVDDFFRNEITFRVIGPLPPYSFSTVEVTRLSNEQVDEARQTLRLGDDISEAVVRNAYRRMAAEGQRGPVATAGAAPAQFAELRHASELLLRYSRASKEAQRGEGRDGLADRDTGCLFAIAIKGTRSDEVEAARFGAAAPVSPGVP